MSEEEHISKEDLMNWQNSRVNTNIARLKAEKAVEEHKNAELASRNLLLTLYLKYKLDEKDSIDLETGVIKMFNTSSNEDLMGESND
jgi:hypothetical protein